MDDNHIEPANESNINNNNNINNENQQQQNILNNVERDLQNGTRRRNDGARNNLNPRDRLFYALFMKIGQLYARLVPKKLRILLEIVVLLKGLLLFSFLSYLHFSFGKVPMNCLNSTIGSWPRDGILRVQIQPEYSLEKQLPRFYSPKQNLVLFHPCHNEKKISSKLCSSLSKDLELYYKYHDKQYALKDQCYRMNLSDFMHKQDMYLWKNYQNYEYIFSDRRGNLFKGFQPGEIIKEDRLLAFYEKYLSPSGVEFKQIRSEEKIENGWRHAIIDDCLRNMKQLKSFLDQLETPEWALLLLKDGVVKGRGYDYVISEGDTNAGFKLLIKPERHYVFEYAQEFGFLRISQEARNRLNIPVKVVSFDPNKEKCFGDTFSRFILKYFLGYDDVLMNSIKKIADAENNTGYMLNVYTGDHYKFVSWGMGRSSYFVSLLLMFLFTISISTLLRYCHQQVFFFIIHLLQMMDMNVVLAFPIAPLFTVILSLVGMETIMSEYFNDTTTSFYIILIVWAVDQFDTICCHTEISQKYWLRFFYLYHFIFYSYHYRFNGQYSSIALAATWFLIQHSMLYFLHNYELPAIENGTNNGRRDEDAYLDEAVQMIVEGIEMVAGQQNNLNHQDVANRENENAANDTNQVANANEYNGEEEQAAEPQEPLDYMVHRVILFAADTSLLQIFREFIRLILEHINIDRRNSGAEQLPGPQASSNVANEVDEVPDELPERTSEEVDAGIGNEQATEPTPVSNSETVEQTALKTECLKVELPTQQTLQVDCSSNDCDCYMQIRENGLPEVENEDESQISFLDRDSNKRPSCTTSSSPCIQDKQINCHTAEKTNESCSNITTNALNDTENHSELFPPDGLLNNELPKNEDMGIVHR